MRSEDAAYRPSLGVTEWFLSGLAIDTFIDMEEKQISFSKMKLLDNSVKG